jgi:hypothetical protein
LRSSGPRLWSEPARPLRRAGEKPPGDDPAAAPVAAVPPRLRVRFREVEGTDEKRAARDPDPPRLSSYRGEARIRRPSRGRRGRSARAAPARTRG